MRIVLDAMGSDHCPVPDVAGAVQAARLTGETIILVGDEPAIRLELAKHKVSGLSIEVVHAPQIVTMADKPSQVTHLKPDSSMAVGLRLVLDGKAEAFVTAGNTGAALALATLGTLKRIPGVKRPALSTLVKLGDKSMIWLDLGANADARPEWIAQFALMGSLYAEHVLGHAQPRVGILSNGEEEGKGSALIKAAALLIPATGVNFIGNVEPHGMMAGSVEVVVCDGFVMNIALKSMEAVAEKLFGLIIDYIKSTPNLLVKFGALLMRPALRAAYHQVDPNEVGGAPLLGINGVVIIGHGRSNAKGIKNAILQAQRAVNGNVVAAIQAGFQHETAADPTDIAGTPIAAPTSH